MNIMSDFRLEIFQCVAKHLNFTKASKELLISQPAVSKNIQELENYYGVRLFERLGSKVELTQAGEKFLELSNEILSRYGNLLFTMYQLSDKKIGTLRIGTTATAGQYILPPLLAEFHNRYPHINVTQVSAANSEAIENMTIKGQIDIGIVEGYARERNLKYIPFMKDRIIPITSISNHTLKKESISTEQIYKIPLVLKEYSSGTYQAIKHALSNHNIDISKLNVCACLDSTEGLKNYLLHSDCIGLISMYAIKYSSDYNLFRILTLKDIRIERDLCFILLSQNETQALSRLFIEQVCILAKNIYGQSNCLCDV